MVSRPQVKSKDSEGMGPRRLGEFDKEEIKEGTVCLFPRKQGSTLRVVNMSR